jgi:hypothetical protein
MNNNITNIDNYINKEWDNYINKDIIWGQKWKKMTQRFWKTELIELFKIWINKTKESQKFNREFKNIVIKGLLKKTWHANFKRTTYRNLMSLFSKFGHFYQKYPKILVENLKVDIDDWKENQTIIKQDIIELFGDHDDNNTNINKWEKEYMRIDDEWNVLPPE